MSSSASSMGIWSVALDTLDPKLKSCLTKATKTATNDIIESILLEAESKKTVCLQKRWRVQVRGKTIILRDLFDKIVAWVNQYKAIVDTAVQFDPTGASLPWAGVRFLIQVCVSDTQCFESTVQGLESVFLLISRYAAFEALYMQMGSTIQSELKRGLTTLYARILSFLAHGIQYFDQSTTEKLAKSVFRFQTAQDRDLQEINTLDEQVIKLAQIVDSQVLQQNFAHVNKIQEIVHKLQDPICRMTDASAIYVKTLQEDNFRSLLKWLSSVPHTQHHKRHSEARISNSAQWLFHQPQYKEWKNSSSSSLFLLSGIPGCGKTCLTSAVIDSFLDEHSLNPLSAPVAYFYCGDNQLGQSRADPEEAIRSLSRQFAVVDGKNLQVHEQIALEYSRREAQAKLDGFEMPRLQGSECADLLLTIFAANPAVIVVDGVDELEKHRRHEILDFLIRIRDESGSVVKVFVSSRDNSNIMVSLPDALVLRVQDLDTKHDMEAFADRCLEKAISTRALLDGNVPNDLRSEIKKFLLHGAGEMFLWVQLQVERLCKLVSTYSVLETLNEPSKTLASIDGLYSKILDDLQQNDPFAYRIAARAFSWLLCMFEPLSTVAFLDAVSVGIPEDQKPSLSELLSICSNLIIADKQLDTLRFAHVSLKEFLEIRSEFKFENAHRMAISSCLETCISRLPIEIPSPAHPHGDYSLYAAMYWGEHHAVAVAQNNAIGTLDEFVFGEDGLNFQFWLETVDQVSKTLPSGHNLTKKLSAMMSETHTPFFAACVFSLREIFTKIVQEASFNIHLKNSGDQTGLYLASAFGNSDAVEILLGLGADPGNSHGRYEDPLSAACAGGYRFVAEFLLGHDFYASPKTVKPVLKISFLMGQEDMSLLILKSYLDRFTDTDEANKECSHWILEEAAQIGLTEIVQELINRQPDALKGGSSVRVATAAIQKGRIPFLKQLLDKGPLPEDAMSIAALFGKPDMINILVDEGYDIEKEGPFGTPLRVSSLMGHETTVRTLLLRGAKINAVTRFGDALQAAAMKGHLSITNTLIQFCAEVNNSGGFFGNALQAAAYRGHPEIVGTLLSSGASIDQPGRYNDAFSAAAEAGKEGVIAVFLAHGYKFPVRIRRVSLARKSYNAYNRAEAAQRSQFRKKELQEEVSKRSALKSSEALRRWKASKDLTGSANQSNLFTTEILHSASPTLCERNDSQDKPHNLQKAPVDHILLNLGVCDFEDILSGITAAPETTDDMTQPVCPNGGDVMAHRE
ncbi:hypothetical protein N7540_011867 [Penicillium herquei]|nr:hypothetical protein N7540_011867 [Penicillium herquei]